MCAMYWLSPVKCKMTYIGCWLTTKMLLLQFIHFMIRNSSFYVEDILEECVYVYLCVLFVYTTLSEHSSFTDQTNREFSSAS